jgi:hypothetical protein
MTEAADIFEVPIQLVDPLGLEEFDAVLVKFYQPNDTQMVMLARGASLAQRMPTKAVHGVAQILDVLDALVVEPEQREWLTDNMIKGLVQLDNLRDVIEGFRTDEREQANSKPKLPVKRARSGSR